MTATYTNRDAAPKLGISDVAVGKRLKAIRAAHPGFIEATMEGKRLTDETVELLKLWADDRDAFIARATQPTEAPATPEAEIFGEYPATPAGSITLASQCQAIADRTGTIAPTSSEPYEQRAAAAQSALAQFIQTNNARASQLASNAVQTRRSFAQLGQEHAIGHLMTYAESMNKTLAEGMAAMQNGAVGMADSMGNATAADIAS